MCGVDTRAIYDGSRGHCHYCQAKLFPFGVWSKSVKVPGARRYAIDHAQPVSRGGTDAPENLRISCVECNREQGMRTEVEFFAVLATRETPATGDYNDTSVTRSRRNVEHTSQRSTSVAMHSQPLLTTCNLFR